jgi:hypothetical protein
LLNIIGLLFRIKARRSGINVIDPRRQRHRVGFAWNALREAFCGEQTGCLLALAYETLTTKPEQALEAVYEFIGEKPFKHDFGTLYAAAYHGSHDDRHAHAFSAHPAVRNFSYSGIAETTIGGLRA